MSRLPNATWSVLSGGATYRVWVEPALPAGIRLVAQAAGSIEARVLTTVLGPGVLAPDECVFLPDTAQAGFPLQLTFAGAVRRVRLVATDAGMQPVYRVLGVS